MQILEEIILIMVGGIQGIGEGIGQGLSSLVGSIFVTTVEGATTLTVFGQMVIIFAAISLAFGLTRWVLNFITSLGARNS